MNYLIIYESVSRFLKKHLAGKSKLKMSMFMHPEEQKVSI